MKETYVKAEMEIVVLETADVITTSIDPELDEMGIDYR